MRVSLLATALAVTLVGGCASPFARSADDAGTEVYVLEAVDGRALPHLHSEGSSIAGRELIEGMLQLRDDGSFFLDLTWLVNSGVGTRRSSRIYEGVWSRYGESIRLAFDDRQVSTSEFVDHVLEIEIDGALYRFVR